MDNRKELIEKILDELNSRGGFDGWWGNIDEDIQEEISETLINILPITNTSTPSSPEDLVKEFKGFADKILQSEEETTKFLVDVGINNPDGSLTERYKP